MCHYESRVTGGLIILTIGVVFLLKNLRIITQPAWSIMWPSILIVVGVGILIEGIRVTIRRKRE